MVSISKSINLCRVNNVKIHVEKPLIQTVIKCHLNCIIIFNKPIVVAKCSV